MVSSWPGGEVRETGDTGTPVHTGSGDCCRGSNARPWYVFMTRPCSSSHDEVRSMNSTPTNRGSRKTSSAQAWHRIGTASATRRSESSALRPIAQVKSCRAGAPDAGFGICGMTQSAMCRCWQKRSRRTRLRRITIESGSWYRLCGGEILSRGRWVTPKDVPSGRPDAGRDVPTRCDDRHLDKSKRG